MANESEGECDNSPAASYTRAFANRGPNKRKVKPSFQSQLLQFTMLSDSEDDEDFVASSEDDDDYSTDHSGGVDEAERKSSDSESGVNGGALNTSQTVAEPSNTNTTDADMVDSDDDSDDEDFEPASNESSQSGGELEQANDDSNMDEEKLRKEQKEEISSADVNAHTATKAKKSERLVCGVCLESESTEEDELVECDCCGITVHEGCYGDAEESIPEDKSDSDAETEPWFCDPCKAKCEGYCELCPVKGGLLKQTDSGKWVHLVCALYVPGVGFRDVDRLQSVVIDDISSSRWSARRCILCEDQRFSRTGVCIECDAGMCKTYFHAMCAQRHGLLTEVPAAGHMNDDDADPLFAHCKAHTDKSAIKSRIRRWTAFETHFKNFKQADDPDEKMRIENALYRARGDYVDFRNQLSPAVQQSTDEPRLVTSSPELCEKMLKKAELMGYSTYSQEVAMNITAYVRACKPTLSCDYVNHFFKRETLTSKYQLEEKPLQEKIEKHRAEQASLQENFGKLKSNLEESKAKRNDLVAKVTKLNHALEKIIGKKIALPGMITKPKRRQRKESETNIDALIHTCETCKGMEDQHLMALCDTCHNYYHIWCLDPPLTALPKKGTKWLWQCTECDKSDSSDESIDEESGPASRRRKRKSYAPKKFTAFEETKSNKKTTGKKTFQRLGNVGRKSKEVQLRDTEDSSSVDTKQELPAKEERQVEKVRAGKKRKAQVLMEPCVVCSKEGDKTIMVKCDECANCYHFKCCEPKLRGNPKKIGYMWFCNDCMDSDSDAGDDVNNGDLNEDNNDCTTKETVKNSQSVRQGNGITVAKENGSQEDVIIE